MTHQDRLDKRLEELEQAEANGQISKAEMWEEMKELQREYREEAEQAAQQAYFHEMMNW